MYIRLKAIEFRGNSYSFARQHLTTAEKQIKLLFLIFFRQLVAFGTALT